MEKKRERVLEFAHRRLLEELKESELGADNDYAIHYWQAYIEGATAQIKECTDLLKAINEMAED